MVEKFSAGSSPSSGLINKVNERDFHLLEKEILSEANTPYRQKFYDEMLDLSFVDDISKDDVLKSIKDVGIKINTNVFLILMCRESQDMFQINGEVIMNYIDLLILKTPKAEEENFKDSVESDTIHLNPSSSPLVKPK
uniref:Uncharacterized protein n=1 Tax=Euplotes harpa TaxID=151035 RepID=A0A7S3NA66_9SPIT|mmetsp:Transcript_29234/g.33488  ORF Transcript_29234/g.33488 Transcript_29234/m.33488 type:complete len:138 (+) Transcript_29234:1011-1424(+)